MVAVQRYNMVLISCSIVEIMADRQFLVVNFKLKSDWFSYFCYFEREHLSSYFGTGCVK